MSDDSDGDDTGGRNSRNSQDGSSERMKRTNRRNRKGGNSDIVSVDEKNKIVEEKEIGVDSDELVDSVKKVQDCVCEEETWKGEQVLCCDKCDRWWHCSCAGLKGLDEPGAKLLVPWLGPCCFILSKTIQDKLGKNSPKTDEEYSITDIVQKEIRDILPEIVSQVVAETTNKNSSPWADLFRKQTQTLEQKIDDVNDNQKLAVAAAMDKNKMLQTVDHVEREKRKKNVVIKDVRESKLDTQVKRDDDDFDRVLEILDIDEEDLISITRAGPPLGKGKNEHRTHPRPIIAMVSTPAIAQQCCGHGTGSKRYIKIRGETEKREYWINADLIYADRKANWESRTLVRQQRQERIDKARAAAAVKQANAPVPAVVQEKPGPSSSVVSEKPAPPVVLPEESVITDANAGSQMPSLTPIITKTPEKPRPNDPFR